MHICKQMLADIPSSVAKIQATNESQMVVNDDELLVVSPIEGHVAKVLKHIVIWMAQNVDIAMARATFGA